MQCKRIEVALEIWKAVAPLLAVALAAWLAWATRRAERLKDAYAEWAAAIHHLIALFKYSELEELRRLSDEAVVVNPEWLEWTKARNDAEQKVRSARAHLLTREPEGALRRVIEELSSVQDDATVFVIQARVDRLIILVSGTTGLFLMRRKRVAANA